MSDLRAILLSTWVLAVLGSVMAGIRDSCSGYAGFWPWLLYVGLLSVSLSLSLSLSLFFCLLLFLSNGAWTLFRQLYLGIMILTDGFMYVLLGHIIQKSVYTSSTAQGGGGSFKNRKPIGEIGCCESEMAERSHCWTERRLISLTLVYLSIYLSICLAVYLSTFGAVSFSVR